MYVSATPQRKQTNASFVVACYRYLVAVNKELLRLAIPNILSNVSVPLLSSVDTALMGHLSAEHLGAVGIASMMFNFLYWNFGFLRMGTTGLTAQSFGANDIQAQGATLLSASALAMLLAVLLWVLQVPLFSLAHFLMNVPEGYGTLVEDYFYTRMWAAPATLMLYVLLGWLFGQQNAAYPLFIAIFSNVVNIICSVYWVKVLNMGTTGVALGTVVAQYASMALALGLIWFKYPQKVKTIKVSWLKQVDRYTRLLKVNADIFLRTLSLTIAFGFFYSQSAAASGLALATTTVLLQFLNWMSYAIDGFAYAAEAMVGKYVGAKSNGGAHRAIKLSMGYGMGLAVLFSLGYWLAGEQLIALFTDEVEVRQLAQNYIPYLVALPIIGTACYIWDGVFVGLTATRAMRNLMLIALIGYLTSYYLLLPHLGELSALWIALLVFLGLRGLLQTGAYLKEGISLR